MNYSESNTQTHKHSKIYPLIDDTYAIDIHDANNAIDTNEVKMENSDEASTSSTRSSISDSFFDINIDISLWNKLQKRLDKLKKYVFEKKESKYTMKINYIQYNIKIKNDVSFYRVEEYLNNIYKELELEK